MDQGDDRPGQISVAQRPTTVIEPPLQRVAMESRERCRYRIISGAHFAFLEGTRRIEAIPKGSRKAKKGIRRFLRSPKVRLSAALKVLGGAQPDLGAAQALSFEADPWRKNHTTVTFDYIPKAKGGHRIICKLPPEMKAVHRMIGGLSLHGCPTTRLCTGSGGLAATMPHVPSRLANAVDCLAWRMSTSSTASRA